MQENALNIPNAKKKNCIIHSPEENFSSQEGCVGKISVLNYPLRIMEYILIPAQENQPFRTASPVRYVKYKPFTHLLTVSIRHKWFLCIYI